ncbi:glycoside hydrolase family 25 protein [Lachnobacterium bovis]|uniref:Lysozyme n=1 Tax=Lachnobacterium bovis TaxID=140626 RepID=A0A1H9SLE0_9FIRM|nr:GH25 family lysozyme [Lachnobacterium bovis]SER85840.1 lysozyme [Lachnobacterium bovis]
MKKRRRYFTLFNFIIFCFIIFSLKIGIMIKQKKLNNYFLSNNYIKGVDLSHYQGDVDMSILKKQGVEFVYAKATEGSSSVDSKYFVNYANSKKNKIYTGAYHFFSFESDGETQAKHYIEVVGNLKGDLIPVVDVEYYRNKTVDKKKLHEELNKFLNTIEKHYGVKAMIYTTPRFYYSYIKGYFSSNPLWIRSVNIPAHIITINKWTMWQYSDNEILSGYNGNEKYIDKNIFKGNKEQLEHYIIH